MATSRVKTIDIDAGLLADTRDAMKPSAEAQDAEVVERALRFYLGRRALEDLPSDERTHRRGSNADRQRGAARDAPRAPQRSVTRVVIDPGVLVSAFISPRKAAPALLVDAFLDGHVEMLVSPALIAELTDVLGREKFAAHASDGRAAAFIAVLLDRAEMVKDTAPGSLKTADADDDYLIAVAQAHKADAVVSGDPHLLDVTSSDLPVLTPREMADRLGLVSSN